MHRLGGRSLTLCALLSGCASAGAMMQVEERNHISASQIAMMQNVSIYEVIARLRPEYFRMRGPTTVMNPAENEIGVYVDNMLFGGILELRNIPASDVYEIHYLSAMNGVTRHGAQHPSGVIEITTMH